MKKEKKNKKKRRKVIRIDSIVAAKSNSVTGVALGCRMPARRDLKWTTRRVLLFSILYKDRLDMHLSLL
jgi:hypothetical protein